MSNTTVIYPRCSICNKELILSHYIVDGEIFCQDCVTVNINQSSFTVIDTYELDRKCRLLEERVEKLELRVRKLVDGY